ncbi:MAG TPA: hypothetical protein VHD14_14735 [Pseudolabrys sp.]|nr:hypothetical protein [Pseudolabrys sp.]
MSATSVISSVLKYLAVAGTVAIAVHFFPQAPRTAQGSSIVERQNSGAREVVNRAAKGDRLKIPAMAEPAPAPRPPRPALPPGKVLVAVRV